MSSLLLIDLVLSRTYAYDHHINDYDYFYICGDDTYVLVDHMRHFLLGDQMKRLQNGYMDKFSLFFADRGANTTAGLRPRPLFMGCPMVGHSGSYVAIGGGPGYIFNRAALQVWGEKGINHFPFDLLTPQEDFRIAEFFSSQGIYISDSQDDQGGFRFTETAAMVAAFNGANSPIQPQRLRNVYGIPIPVGVDFASEHVIAMHLKIGKEKLKDKGYSVADLMYRYHAWFEDWCSNDNATKTLSEA